MSTKKLSGHDPPYAGAIGQDEFTGRLHIKHPAYGRIVADVNSAQLDVIVGRNDDFGMRLNIVVAAAKRGTPHCERGLYESARCNVG